MLFGCVLGLAWPAAIRWFDLECVQHAFLKSGTVSTKVFGELTPDRQGDFPALFRQLSGLEDIENQFRPMRLTVEHCSGE